MYNLGIMTYWCVARFTLETSVNVARSPFCGAKTRGNSSRDSRYSTIAAILMSSSRVVSEYYQNHQRTRKEQGQKLRTTDTAIMTDVTSTSIQADTQYRDSLEKNLCRLREENAELRDHASQVKKCSPCEKCLKDDDQQVKFYTGLPTYVSLMAIFRFVSVSISASRNPQSLSTVPISVDEATP